MRQAGNWLAEPEGFPQALGQKSLVQQSLSTAWGRLLAGTPLNTLTALFVFHVTRSELRGRGYSASREEYSTTICYHRIKR